MIIIRGLFVVILLTFPALAQSGQYGLPAGAQVIESRKIPAAVRANRMIVLWMISPKRNPLGYGPEEYTCPDATRGSYYEGPTRVSLVNTKTNQIINTVSIAPEQEADTFDVPYKVKGMYYDVSGVRKGHEGKPTIIALKDYNGDGKPLEFAFYNAEACMGLGTTLIGYSERRDHLLQYPIVLTVTTKADTLITESRWADYLFSKTPRAHGHWKYEIDYRGRAGTLDQYDVHYNAARERFEGTLKSTTGD